MPVYLDYHATTPLDEDVFSIMKPFFMENFGNPSSGQHAFGWKASHGVDKARKQVAKVIGSKAKEIFFTSGATESNNWALCGFLESLEKDEPVHIITSNIEHKSVLECFQKAQDKGVDVTFLKADSQGRISIEDFKKALKPSTKFVSFIFANNEVGSINPIEEVGAITREKGIIFHTDATQAIGKVDIDVDKMNIDLLSLSAHKIYGPKGAGALYIRSQNPKIRIEPHVVGGGQERGMRSGTLNVPGIVGLGAACELVQNKMSEELPRLEKLRDHLVSELKKLIPDMIVNGHPEFKLINNANLSFPKTRPEILMEKLGEIAISTGSACSSASVAPSYVLTGIGLDPELARSTVRVGLGRWTTPEHIELAIQTIAKAVEASRRH